MLGANEIRLSESEIVFAGGFESMSNAPHLLKGMRAGVKFGDSAIFDSNSHDGLIDAYQKIPMGACTEKTAKEMGITREI